ncbi:MAG TPA: DUF2934 domain-containing protein [Terriglobia bacterium]|nr:DUF2934 domain-containing protein [Terriglobia bacterium]
MEHAAARRRRAPLPAKPEPDPKPNAVTEEDVRRRAYEIYLERGAAPGNELDDWLKAELELKGK